MTTTCGEITAALDHRTEAVEAQTSTSLFQGTTLTQQVLSRQLHWPGTQFASVHNQTTSLIEDE